MTYWKSRRNPATGARKLCCLWHALNISTPPECILHIFVVPAAAACCCWCLQFITCCSNSSSNTGNNNNLSNLRWVNIFRADIFAQLTHWLLGSARRPTEWVPYRTDVTGYIESAGSAETDPLTINPLKMPSQKGEQRQHWWGCCIQRVPQPADAFLLNGSHTHTHTKRETVCICTCVCVCVLMMMQHLPQLYKKRPWRMEAKV